jgi:hypothetical protein
LRKKILKALIRITSGLGNTTRYVPHARGLENKLGLLDAVIHGNLEGLLLKHGQKLYGELWYKLKNKQYPGYRNRWQRFQGKQAS